MCHTHTHNTTLVYVCDILVFCEVNISFTSTTWISHLSLNVIYSFSSTTSKTSKKLAEYWALLSPEILSYVCYLKINDTIILHLCPVGLNLVSHINGKLFGPKWLGSNMRVEKVRKEELQSLYSLTNNWTTKPKARLRGHAWDRT
jgi:hypothetical protein